MNQDPQDLYELDTLYQKAVDLEGVADEIRCDYEKAQHEAQKAWNDYYNLYDRIHRGIR